MRFFIPGIPAILLNKWVLLAGAGVVTYSFYKSAQKNRRRLKEAKEELIEQQRTIDRLRAEVARARGGRPDAASA
ncbi:MAG TPA: hypothetical protein VFF73_23230 [Planctomycetota bacterium]|nr:hypothetical protein [Planctomycetota bacterium]